MENYLTVKQAGAQLGIHESRVRHLIGEGRLPAEKVGGIWLIHERDLDRVRDRKPGKPKRRNFVI